MTLSAPPHYFSTVANLFSDETLSYTPGAGLVEVHAGDLIDAQGFRYQVAPSDAADHHIETAGGAKLYVLPDNDGYFRVDAFGALGNNVDDTVAIQKAASVSALLRFRAGGLYRIKQTIICGSFARWVGGVPMSSLNTAGRARIYATRADLGDGTPLVKPAATGLSSQSLVFENLEFMGDLPVQFNDLSITPNEGIVGVDVSGAKQGTEFIQCCFRNLWKGVAQLEPPPTTPYCDKITLNRCHFMANRLAVDANPTAGISLIDTFIYDCYDWIRSTTDVSLINCSLNNSSFASTRTGIRGRNIDMIGGWTEGGNGVFQPSRYLYVESIYASETFSDTGSTKVLIIPQGNNVAIRYVGSRVPTNTRLLHFTNVPDQSTIHIIVEGAYGGSNFSIASTNIGFHLGDGGIRYTGRGNSNSPAWNVPGARKYYRNRSGAYTFALSDSGTITRSFGPSDVWTIPANASVAFPVGTVIDVFNGAAALSIEIEADTLYFNGATGSRSVAVNTKATLTKVQATVWTIEGGGVS